MVVRALSLHLGDPFARIIVATAIEEMWTVLSIDEKMDQYSGAAQALVIDLHRCTWVARIGYLTDG